MLGYDQAKRYDFFMSIETAELIRICEQLPEHKRAEVADFAQFLLARESDERWEEILASGTPRPRLDAFLNESSREPSMPLDPSKL